MVGFCRSLRAGEAMGFVVEVLVMYPYPGVFQTLREPFAVVAERIGPA